MSLSGAIVLLLAAVSGTTPFPAWVGATSAYVRAGPAQDAAVVGLVRYGDTVEVVGCVPDCAARNGWALLAGDGAIRLSLLRTDERPRAAEGLSAPASYTWGNTRRRAPVRAEPDPKARVVRHEQSGRSLAFRADEALRAGGWLERPEGGYLRVEDVRLAEPSTFAGEHDPVTPLAFVVRALDGLDRYARLPVLGADAKNRVLTEGGLLPRSAVRLVFARPRPREVPEGARWVHVDLTEQVLGAYEGDRLVFATLVSTGREDATHRTSQGVFQVHTKTVHHTMRGTPEDPYEVDEVPFAMFFLRGQGFHGTFWHDGFGAPRSHGCVNLSLADAAWLFAWAPPWLPPGWHTVMPLPTARESLWVHVERATALPLVRLDDRPAG